MNISSKRIFALRSKMSRIIIRKITSITSIITPRDSRSQVWSASSTVPVAIDTLAYKTLDGNGSFEKRGNNRRNKILDSILLAAGEKEKILPRWIFALFSKAKYFCVGWK